MPDVLQDIALDQATLYAPLSSALMLKDSYGNAVTPTQGLNVFATDYPTCDLRWDASALRADGVMLGAWIGNLGNFADLATVQALPTTYLAVNGGAYATGFGGVRWYYLAKNNWSSSIPLRIKSMAAIRSDILLYDIQNTRFPRETEISLYAEGVVQPGFSDSSSMQKITLGNIPKFPIKRTADNTQNIQTSTINVPVYFGDTKVKDTPVSLRTTKASALSTFTFKPLFIGDSISASTFTGVDAGVASPWGLPSMVKSFWLRDNLDGLLGGCVTLGNGGNIDGRSITYRGQSLPLRSFHQSRGGWCSDTWLRHPVLMTASGINPSPTYANALASWDLCGFTTFYGRAYSGSVDDKNLIRMHNPTLTIGSYDYSAAIWDFLRARAGWTGPQTLWVDNSTNRAYVDVAVAAIAANPDNPFWKPGVDFNPYNWTDRWKTLASDGLTRLVVGSTAGSLINSGNINSIDVTSPTHVFIELGENDRWMFPADMTKTVANLISFKAKIDSAYGWMGASAPKTAYIIPRNPGCYNPFALDGKQSIQMNIGNAQWKYDLANSLRSAGLVVIDESVQCPASSAGSSTQIYNYMDSGDYVDACGFDAIHPGLRGLWGLAWQAYAWMYSTQAAA